MTPVARSGKEGTYTQPLIKELCVAEKSRLEESGTVTWPEPEELNYAWPWSTRPVVHETLPTSAPVWPFPVLSAVVVPLPSLNFHSATRPL